MKVSRDYRLTGLSGEVMITMSLAEFREHVEWLETYEPHDGATHNWRQDLDRIDPPEPEDPPKGPNAYQQLGRRHPDFG